MNSFLKVECVKQIPGNPKTGMYVRANTVTAFGEAAPEYAQTGGVSFIDIGPMDRMILTNEVADLYEQIERAER